MCKPEEGIITRYMRERKKKTASSSFKVGALVAVAGSKTALADTAFIRIVTAVTFPQAHRFQSQVKSTFESPEGATCPNSLRISNDAPARSLHVY